MVKYKTYRVFLNTTFDELSVLIHRSLAAEEDEAGDLGGMS
jgi:hypothetical protein